MAHSARQTPTISDKQLDAQARVNVFMQELRQDLDRDRLPLPSLPRVAEKVRQCLCDPNSGVEELVALISTDAALTSRVIQIANSPFYGGTANIHDIGQATLRLGRAFLGNMVLGLSISKVFRELQSPAIKSTLASVWNQSTRVAATAQVLAKRFTSIPPEKGMLACLTHNIGSLPVIARYAHDPSLLPSPALLDRIIHTNLSQLNVRVLTRWELPADIIEANRQFADLMREHEGEADLADLMTVSVLHATMGNDHPSYSKIDWCQIPALRKFGLDPESSLEVIKETQAEIDAIRQLIA